MILIRIKNDTNDRLKIKLEFPIKIDTVKSGWSIVYNEG